MAGPIGGLHGVMLTNGEVYYGVLVQSDRNGVAFSYEHYERIETDPNTNERTDKLIDRRTDWHSPTLMLVPRDKVLVLKQVGSHSTVARGIEADRSH